jgi:plastocyanin
MGLVTVNRRTMKLLCTLIAAVTCLAVAGPAAAQVSPEGTGEPAYTSSTQNTQWFRYSQPSGTDDYRLKFMYYANGALVQEQNVNVTGTGTTWANWSGVATLQHGGQYGICVQGYYSFPNDSLYYPDGPNSCSMGTMEGKRSHTTIDRSKPTTSATAAGGAEFTKNASIPLSLAFQDDVAGPFPANFVCVAAGTGPCEGTYGYSGQCSQPATGGKNTTFACAIDASSLSDGPVTICAKAADASVPDNPSSANQSRQAGNANLSDASCDTVVLDRQAPAASVTPSRTTVQAGEAVSFASDAADATSGIDSASLRYEWSDGFAAASGATATRTFTQQGTYVVTFRAKDKAGNETSIEKTITVEGPAGQVSTPGTTPGSTPGAPAPAASPGLASVRIGSLTLLVPKRARLGRVKQLLLAARTDQAGTLTLRLTRGKKVLSRLTVGLSPGQSKQRLRVPRRLKAGTYAVKIAFKPAGASRSTAATAKVAFRK